MKLTEQHLAQAKPKVSYYTYELLKLCKTHGYTLIVKADTILGEAFVSNLQQLIDFITSGQISVSRPHDPIKIVRMDREVSLAYQLNEIVLKQ